MPRIKLSHIVAFSSEDPDNPADNLLNNDVKKVWLCKNPKDTTANVTIQFDRISKITAIDICNEGSCFIEVLVGRSGAENQAFKSLLPMSSFMTIKDAKDGKNRHHVRLFQHKDLLPETRDEKWDRVKINCSQPYNHKDKFGVGHIVFHRPLGEDEKEETIVLYDPLKKKKDEEKSNHEDLGKFHLRPESPDNLSPGGLFSKRKETISEELRRLSSKDWLDKNGPPKCNTIKMNHNKPSTSRSNDLKTEAQLSSKRNSMDLYYTVEDDEPDKKIDEIMAAKREEDEKLKKQKEKDPELTKKVKKTSTNTDTPIKKNNNETNTTKRKKDSTPKRMTVNDSKKKIKLETKPFNQLLGGVIFTISGIVNPERAQLRDKALQMGAKYRPNWDDSCTHLICAFANTPKFKEVQGKGKIVKKEWISDCHEERKRLPWRRYALDKNDVGSESENEILEEKPDESKTPDYDTDEEVERILKKQKVKQGNKEKKLETVLQKREQMEKQTELEKPKESHRKLREEIEQRLEEEQKPIDKDREVEKEKQLGNESAESENQSDDQECDPFGMETDEEQLKRNNVEFNGEIPKILNKELFYIDDSFTPTDCKEVARKIQILNGLVFKDSDAVSVMFDVNYIVTDNCPSGLAKANVYKNAVIVSVSWIYDMYASQRHLPIEKYLITNKSAETNQRRHT